MSAPKTKWLVAIGAIAVFATLYGALVAKHPLFVAIYDRFLAGALGVALLLALPVLAVVLWQRRASRSSERKPPEL